MSLSALGWTPSLATAFATSSSAAAGLEPARVALEHKHAYELLTGDGALDAVCTGRLLHAAGGRADLPAVGDWVVVQRRPGERQADIHAVIPRRTKFSRQSPGGGEQIVATNVDTVLLVTALDENYNLRRIERYLTLAWDSGAQPVVVLNKADLHPDPSEFTAEVSAIAAGAAVVTLSATRDDALTALKPWLAPGHTLALLGSSGVGKSTLINRLIGADRQRTSAVSAAVHKGRHTTTARELILAPEGFLVIDTPGMRELQLWEVDAGAIDTAFNDIATLAARCRFTDCSHRHEPGCAIQSALEDGTLPGERWESYQKLQREQAYAARKANPQLARATKEQWRRLHRQHRAATRQTREDE